MAKWGEGDPRWIVEERADATNVNNWHWTEKNATSWSKDKLRSLLEGLTIENDQYCCKIEELSTLEGEASASNRKAKLIFFWEWVIKGEWKGKIKGMDKFHKGKLDIPNLSDENDADDIDVNITVNNLNDDSFKLKNFMRKEGLEVIQEKLAQYIRELREEYSQGMILPTKSEASQKGKEDTPKINNLKQKMSQTVASSSQAVGVKIPCKKIVDKEEFKCQAMDIYRALTEPEMVRAFTRGPVDVVAEKGGRFSLYGDNVIGEFVQLEPYSKLVLRWRFKSWPNEHYSTVTIKLEEKDDCTKLELTQIGVPDSDYDRTKQGWKTHYWENIKQTFGYGARLY